MLNSVKINTFAALLLLIVSFVESSVASAEGFQSYAAGVYPIQQRLKEVEGIMAAIEARLAAPDITLEEKSLRKECLQRYEAEKQQLNEDLQAGKKISEMPGVKYLTSNNGQECTIGLTRLSHKEAGH